MDSITIIQNNSPITEIRCLDDGTVETEFLTTLTPFLVSGLVVKGVSHFFSNLLPEGSAEKLLIRSLFGIAEGEYSALSDAQQYEFFKVYAARLLNNIYIEGRRVSKPPLHDSLTLLKAKQLVREPRQVKIAGVQLKVCARDRGGCDWILKFGSKEVVIAEQCGMLLSTASGIETAKHKLIEMKGGGLAFECLRFDIDEPRLIVDGCQLLNIPPSLKYLDTSFDNYLDHPSYESFGAELMLYAKDPRGLMEEYFRRVVFAYLIGNDDLHLKNFSFFMEDSLISGFTPQYDAVMIEAINPHGIQSMAIDLLDQDSQGLFSPDYEFLGYYSRPDFIRLATSLGVGEPEQIIDQLVESITRQIADIRKYPVFYEFFQQKKKSLLQ